jgi:hypothetical protein
MMPRSFEHTRPAQLGRGVTYVVHRVECQFNENVDLSSASEYQR